MNWSCFSLALLVFVLRHVRLYVHLACSATARVRLAMRLAIITTGRHARPLRVTLPCFKARSDSQGRSSFSVSRRDASVMGQSHDSSACVHLNFVWSEPPSSVVRRPQPLIAAARRQHLVRLRKAETSARCRPICSLVALNMRTRETCPIGSCYNLGTSHVALRVGYALVLPYDDCIIALSTRLPARTHEQRTAYTRL